MIDVQNATIAAGVAISSTASANEKQTFLLFSDLFVSCLFVGCGDAWYRTADGNSGFDCVCCCVYISSTNYGLCLFVS
jgi:hypothetical protein